jgi:hypothetical protein
MSDIAKCHAEGCPLSLCPTCWRYVAAAHDYQSWIFPEVVNGQCPNYLPVYPSHTGQMESGR